MKLLPKFASWWNTSLEHTTTVKHPTDLKPDSRPRIPGSVHGQNENKKAETVRARESAQRRRGRARNVKTGKPSGASLE